MPGERSPSHASRSVAHLALVGLTWLPAIGMLVVFMSDMFGRFLLNAPMHAELGDQMLRFFGYCLLAAVVLGAALSARQWRHGDRRDLTALVVWPGLPIASVLVLLAFLVLAAKARGIAAPLEMLANPLAAHAHAAVYMAAAVAALAFGSYDQRLASVAAAPTALLMLPYLSADLSISQGIAAQYVSLAAVAVVCAIAAIAARRLWPVAAACGAAIFSLVFYPILIGLMTPTEAFALACVLAAIPVLIVVLVSRGGAGLISALHAGAREIAGIAAVIACASVVPMLFTLFGLPVVRVADVSSSIPGPAVIVVACLAFVALAVVLTPLLAIALVGALSVVGPFSAPMQGLQAAVLVSTVPFGLAAMALRQAFAARTEPADALLPERVAQLLALALLVIGCGAALFLRRTVPL